MAVNKKRSKFNTLWNSPIRILNFILLFALVGIWLLIITKAAPVPGFYGSVEQDQAVRINYSRTAYGLSGLQHIECLNSVAEGWAQSMAKSQILNHNPNFTTQIDSSCGSNWTKVAENVGSGGDSVSIFNAFMNSAGHKANILNPAFTKMGVGAYYDSNGKLWITQLFANCSSCSGPWVQNAVLPLDPLSNTFLTTSAGLQFFLRNTNSNGAADISFNFGSGGDIALSCDWNGDGVDTPGVYRPNSSTFYLNNKNAQGIGEIVFSYGTAGDKPICGDWNGDGIDSIGIYRPSNGTFYLRNSNNSGNADLVAVLGNPNEIPIVCDWNGDGKDTIGIKRGDSFYIQNTNVTSSSSVTRIIYGASTDEGICGDWNGDGVATIGVKRGNIYYLRNSNSSGTADVTFGFGDNTDRPIVGDYNGDRVETIGIYR
jgi:hypothetical protein